MLWFIWSLKINALFGCVSINTVVLDYVFKLFSYQFFKRKSISVCVHARAPPPPTHTHIYAGKFGLLSFPKTTWASGEDWIIRFYTVGSPSESLEQWNLISFAASHMPPCYHLPYHVPFWWKHLYHAEDLPKWSSSMEQYQTKLLSPWGSEVEATGKIPFLGWR